MKLKRFLAMALMVLVLVTAAAACGETPAPFATGSESKSGGEDSSAASELAGTGETEKIVYSFIVMGNEPADLQPVQDAINEITIPEIGVEVELQATAVGSYPEQLTLAITGAEPLDLLCTIPSGSAHFNNMTAQNQLISLNDLLDTYGDGIQNAVGDKFLEGTTIDGNIYGVTTVYGKSTITYAAMRTDILEANGLLEDAENASSLSDLEAIFEKVYAADSSMPVLVGSSGGNILNLPGVFMSTDPFADMPLYDDMGDGTNNLAVVRYDDPTKVISLYEAPETKAVYDKVREWYQNGWIHKDAATTQDTCQEIVKQGKGFGYFFLGEVDAKTSQKTATGYDMTLVEIATNPVQTGSLRKFAWAIPVTSQHPEAAMKFLNMTYSDERIVNLLNYGIEGTHYAETGDGFITYAEGVDSTNSGWGLTTSFLFGNQLLAKVWEGNEADIREKTKELNDSAEVSPILGFSFDNSGVTNELASLTNVISQYRPALQSGVATEENLDTFISALKDAGLDTYVNEMQAQLDAFLADK